MKVPAFFLVALMAVTLVSCLPLDLGFGGVYDSPEANAYWARRFGRGFFSNLASIQKNINNVAEQNRASIDIRTPVDLEEEQIDNDLSIDQVPAQALPALQPGPLFFENVNF